MSDADPVARRRRRALFAVGLCAGAVIAIVVLAVVLSENVVYFRTVSEAVRERAQQGDDRFRMAGEVVPGSVVETPHGVRFRVTDGKATATVKHTGDPPELFKPGAPVVCEGHWGSGKAFDSDRIMIRHGNEYRPPNVDSRRGASR
ncbi:MAG TPA: cytochrome c maturation protein CcmE [Acidimicrobiia bacterium]|jgi:cytochrome c-type biogenesis protein CcmE